MSILSRLKTAWNAFATEDASVSQEYYGGTTSYTTAPPSQPRRRYSSERTIISSIYNRIAIDVAAVSMFHVQLDDQGRYEADKDSALNTCLNLEPNLDQGPRQFRQDIVMTLFDKGIAAIVPVDTAVDPTTNEVFDIYTLRVGEICDWYPKSVKVSVWNEDKNARQNVILQKRMVAIVQNPLYSVMNEPNSTLQRLIRKLSLLDTVDEQSSSGKLDLIIQLPYVVKTEARRQQAEQRRSDIEVQLKGSQYGIAYADATEKITQLNRPAENNLLKQVEYLTNMLYGQLGITEAVMNGTADEATMLNYKNRTIEPIVDAIVEAMQRSFIGRVGTKKGEKILFFDDPFKLVPIGQMAEVADVFSRNEIIAPNEFRGFMRIKPSNDPKADELKNSNMPDPNASATATPSAPAAPDLSEMDSMMKEVLDGLESEVDGLVKKASSG